MWRPRPTSERDEVQGERRDLASELNVVTAERDGLQRQVQQAQATIASLEGAAASADPDVTAALDAVPASQPATDGIYLNELEPDAGTVYTDAASLASVEYRNVVRLKLKHCGLSPADSCGGSSDTRNSATWADPVPHL